MRFSRFSERIERYEFTLLSPLEPDRSQGLFRTSELMG